MPTKTTPAPQPDTIGAKALERIAGCKQEIAQLRGRLGSEKLLFGWGFDDVAGVMLAQSVSSDIHNDLMPPDGRGYWVRLAVKTRQEAIDLVDRMKPHAIPLVLTTMRYEYDHPVLPADCLPHSKGTRAGWHGVWQFLKKSKHFSPEVQLCCWLRKDNVRLHVVVHVWDPWDDTSEGADFGPFCPEGCQIAENSIYHFAYVPPKGGRLRLSERYPGMISVTQSQPSIKGTYRVRLDHGSVTKAYWTGELWDHADVSMRHKGPTRSWRFHKMIREWEPPAKQSA